MNDSIIKNIAKRFLFGKKRYFYSKTPILKVKELAQLLKIEIPDVYQNEKNNFLTETSLFAKLENKDEITKNLTLRYFNKRKYFKNKDFSFKRFKTRYQEGIKIFKNTDEELMQMATEWLYVFEPLGYYFHDYYDYELYNKTIKEAKTFLSRRFWKKVYQTCNDGSYIKYLKNKRLFNKKFKKFVHRDFYDARKISFEKFQEFIKKNPKFFSLRNCPKKPILTGLCKTIFSFTFKSIGLKTGGSIKDKLPRLFCLKSFLKVITFKCIFLYSSHAFACFTKLAFSFGLIP